MCHSTDTVPIHSIRRSQVTGPAEPLKGHRCPWSQTRVLKSKRNTKNAEKTDFFSGLRRFWNIYNSEHLQHTELFYIPNHIFYTNKGTFWLLVHWNLDMVTLISSIRWIQNFGKAVTGHKACQIEWIGTVATCSLRHLGSGSSKAAEVVVNVIIWFCRRKIRLELFGFKAQTV